MRFPDVIVAGDGALLVPAIRSQATFLDGMGQSIPVWILREGGQASVQTLSVDVIDGPYGASLASGATINIRPTRSTFGDPTKPITQGAPDSGGAGKRALVVPN